MSSEKVDDDTLLATDFIPMMQETSEKSQPDGKKNEIRKKKALIIEKWAKVPRQHTMMFCSMRGQEHHKERMGCILESERVHEARHDLFAVETISNAYDEMNFMYFSQIREGARKVMRLGDEGAKKPSFVRIALNPTSMKTSRWGYPTTFLTHHPSGLWMGRATPRMDEKYPMLRGRR